MYKVPLAKSEKSYGLAVCLCGIFGMAGIHHFYIGHYIHGALDLSALIIGLYLLNHPDLFFVLLGGVILAIDALHSLIVFYRLIIGKVRDRHGLPIRH